MPPFQCAPYDLFLPEVIDFNLQHNADHPGFTYAAKGTSELATITYLEFGRAAHRVAHRLRPNREGQDAHVVALMGLVDTPLYLAVSAGINTAGFLPFLISPRMSAASIVHLLQKASCHRLLTNQTTLKTLVDQVRSLVASISPTFELLMEEIPSMADMYPKLSQETGADPFQPYPAAVQRPSLDDICAYLHSSGSTGLPKPIPQTNRIIIETARLGHELVEHDPPVKFCAIGIPSFHSFGWTANLVLPLYNGTPVAIYPPTVTPEAPVPVMPSPSDVIQHARLNNVNCLVTVPSYLQAWAMSTDTIDYLKTMEGIIFGGGALGPAFGNQLSDAGVLLCQIYGATEAVSLARLLRQRGDEKDWQYVRFQDRVKIRWAPQGDGTFECQVLTWDKYHPLVENLPDVKGYATSDLFQPHPTKPDLWKPLGRMDDVIVHSSGEKTVPAPIEAVVVSISLVQETVMFGRAHDQAGILIEPAPGHEIDVTDDVQLATLRNGVWPIIEEANRIAPAFSRIFKEMILFTSKGKPLPRAGKGTVMRQAALKLYDAEIEALYQEVEKATKQGEAIPPPSWSGPMIEEWLLKQAVDISVSNLSPSVDLFEQGFDSLYVTFFRRRIVGAMGASEDLRAQKATKSISQDIVYKHPTIQQLAAYIAEIVAHSGDGSVFDIDQKVAVERMIEKYSVGLEGPLTAAPSVTQPPVGSVILLTGSTGNLGSSLLASLLEDPRVKRVYAFNRTPAGNQPMLERHIAKFEDRGLDVTLLQSEKLVFICGDTALPNLGIDSTLYDTLRTSADVIIHNAWKVDFNLSLSSFEPHIRGTRHLIDLALSGPNPSSTRFVFTSSISSVQGWDRSEGPVPEGVLQDASVAVGIGYGESKYIAERVLSKSGLLASSVRIGQISGGRPNGAWATTDWVPILVKSSLVLGILPNAHLEVSWLPADAFVSGIIDIVFSPERLPVVLNMVHPHPVPWHSVISAIKAALKDKLDRDLEVVKFHEWFSCLESRAEHASEQDMIQIPAIKLLEFFRHVKESDEELETESGNHVTPGHGDMLMTSNQTIGKLRQFEAADAMLWVEYWREKGFLN